MPRIARLLTTCSLSAALWAPALLAQAAQPPSAERSASAPAHLAVELLVTSYKTAGDNVELTPAQGEPLLVPLAAVRARKWQTLLGPDERPGLPPGELPALTPPQMAVARVARAADGTVSRAAIILFPSREEAEKYLADRQANARRGSSGPVGSEPSSTTPRGPRGLPPPPPGGSR